MAGRFDRMWRRGEARLDASFGEPLELRPMARGDVNGRPEADGSRAVITDLVGIFDTAPADLRLGEGVRSAGAGGAGVKHLLAGTSLVIRSELLPYEVRVGDLVWRPAEMDGTTTVRPAELYRVQAPGVADSGGRMVLPLTLVPGTI